MEDVLTILELAGIGALSGVSTYLLLRKKRHYVYTMKNVTWWIEKHLNDKMLTSTKPKVVDKVYGQYAYITNASHNDVKFVFDKLFKRTRTTQIDQDFIRRLAYFAIAKQFVSRPFLMWGIIRNKYLPKSQPKKVSILPKGDAIIYETTDVLKLLEGKKVNEPLPMPRLYYFVKVGDAISYFILFVNRNAVRLFEPGGRYEVYIDAQA